MIDFIVDLFTDIGAFFVELWVKNKILGKKRKKNEQQDEKEPLME